MPRSYPACPNCGAPLDGASLRLDVRNGESSGFCRPPPPITLTPDDIGAMARAMVDPDDEGRPLDRAIGEE